MISKEDIIVMTYNADKCYPEILSLDEALERYKDKFFVNLETEEWFSKNKEGGTYNTLKIGEGYSYGQRCYNSYIGGIFNRRNLKHLNTMSYFIRYAEESHGGD